METEIGGGAMKKILLLVVFGVLFLVIVYYIFKSNSQPKASEFRGADVLYKKAEMV